ncbi:MAG: Gfo/Idh/MocA family protein [Mycoplasmatales bacterium]
MSKLKYGIIGCGGIFTGKHSEGLKAVKDEVEVVAVCDIDLTKAQIAANKYGLDESRVFTDYKELLKITEIDAVLVLTPNRSHSFISVDALHAGKHVMCEKPMAINAEEAKKMVDAAQETGKLLTVAYQNRFRQDSLYLKQVCENGDLGEIYYGKAHAIRRKAVPTWGVFTNEFEQGGGPLIDIGTHALDLTLWTMDNYEPQMVVGTTYHKLGNNPYGNAFGEWKPEEMTVEDSAFGYITMKNGATIYLESSWALNTLDEKEAKCTLHGVAGGSDMENDKLTINSIKYGKQHKQEIDLRVGSVPFFEGEVNTPEALEARTFMKAIKNEGELLILPEQAYTVTRILEAIYESAKSNKPVYLD